MSSQITGIHHITALANDPQRNLDFYVGVLGLRLVKQTVNFDAPGVYHLYYGDEIGTPGTILTFFPFPDAARGKRGSGEISAVAFGVPLFARDYWFQRLAQHGISFEGPFRRFDHEVISFRDPDGMLLEFAFTSRANAGTNWEEGPVPPEFALQGFHGVTLTLAGLEKTASLLTDTLQFRLLAENGGIIRFVTGDGSRQAAVDIRVEPALAPARASAGSVHHIAWGVHDDASHRSWQEKIAAARLSVTGILDRQYFHSLYFHEPGGVLFEIATDPPGFLRDETKDQLGTQLMLPPWLEPHRHQIEQSLPPISPPAVVSASIR